MGEMTSTSASSSAAAIPPIPAWLCWTTNILAQLNVFFFSGLIFGWAPLELMLLREGQYSELCVPATDAATDLAGIGSDGSSMLDCSEQTNTLHGLFSIGQFWLSFASLPVGYILDHLPKPMVMSLCAAVMITGLLLFAISDSNGNDYFLLSYSLLAIGGCMTTLGSYPATFLLPNAQTLLLAASSCLFDASSVTFYLFEILQERYGTERRTMFICYALWASFMYSILVGCWILLERMNWKEFSKQQKAASLSKAVGKGNGNGVGDDLSLATDDNRQSQEQQQQQGNQETVEGVDPHALWIDRRGVHKLTVWQQLRTYDFGLALVYASVQMPRCNFFIMTVDDFLLSIGDVTSAYAKAFSLILPCGVIFVPWIERTVRKVGILNTVQVANTLGLVFGIVLWIPSLNLQIANFFLFTSFRAFLYSTLNTFLAMSFGVETMGRVLGCAYTIAAVFSLLEYPLAVWTKSYAGGDYLYANVLVVLLGAVPMYCVYSYGKMAKADRRDYRYETTKSLLSDAESAYEFNSTTYGSTAGTETANQRMGEQ